MSHVCLPSVGTNEANLYTSEFKRSGGEVKSSVVVKPLEYMGGGFGLVAQRYIGADEIVVSIPEQLTLTVKNCRTKNKLPVDTNPISSICVELMRSRLACIEASLKTTSNNQYNYPNEHAGLSLAHYPTISPHTQFPNEICFYLWISRLPKQYDNLISIHPYGSLHTSNEHPNSVSPLISCAQVDAWETEIELFRTDLKTYMMPLLGSERYCLKVIQEIEAWRNLAAKSSHLFPKMPSLVAKVLRERKRQLPDAIAKHFHSKRILVELFGWAYSSLISRGFFHLDDTWVMMPWVDYFNFSQEPNTRWFFNKQKRSYEFKVVRTLRPGQELLIRYGEHSDFELLMWYGFKLCRETLGTKLWCHQSKCCYTFSPQSDASGTYSELSNWMEEIITTSGLNNESAKVQNFCSSGFSKFFDSKAKLLENIDIKNLLGKCWVSRDTVSRGMFILVNQICKWLSISRACVLLQILSAELNSFWKPKDFNLTDVPIKHEMEDIQENFFHFHNSKENPVLDSCRSLRDDSLDLLIYLTSLSPSMLESILAEHD